MALAHDLACEDLDRGVVLADRAQVIEGDLEAMLVDRVSVVQVRLCVHGHNGSGFGVALLCRSNPAGACGAVSICSGPSVPSARALRRLLLGLRVVVAYPAWFPNNVARNSPAGISDFEIVSLGLQRLWGVSKNDQVKLRATFGGGAQSQFIRASSAARCSRASRCRRSTGAAAAEQVHRDGHARGHQRRPPAPARRLRALGQRRQDQDQHDARRHPHRHVLDEARVTQRLQDLERQRAQRKVDDEDDHQERQQVAQRRSHCAPPSLGPRADPSLRGRESGERRMPRR